MAAPHPNRAVDITDTFDRKVAALRRHESQVGHGTGLEERLRSWAPPARVPPGWARDGWPSCSRSSSCRLRGRPDGRAGHFSTAGAANKVRMATWNVNSLKVRMDRVPEWLGYARAGCALPPGDQAFGCRLSPYGLCRPWLRVRAPRVGPVERRCHPVPGRGRGSRHGICRRGRARPGHQVGDGALRRGAGLQCVRAQRAQRRFRALRLQAQLVGPPAKAPGARWRNPTDAVAVCGDFNIAPTDKDVWDPAAFVGATHVTPEERHALPDLESWGLVGRLSPAWPEEGLYTYWDYRAGDFHEHRGMRIDLVLVSKVWPGRSRGRWSTGTHGRANFPSDHAPLFVDVEV